MKYSPFEARLFAAATGALVAESVDAAHVKRFLGELAARAPWHVSWGLRALLWLVWLAPLLLALRLKTFLSIDEPGRVALWQRALRHERYVVRQLALVVKAIACLCHYDLDSP